MPQQQDADAGHAAEHRGQQRLAPAPTEQSTGTGRDQHVGQQQRQATVSCRSGVDFQHTTVGLDRIELTAGQLLHDFAELGQLAKVGTAGLDPGQKGLLPLAVAEACDQCRRCGKELALQTQSFGHDLHRGLESVRR